MSIWQASKAPHFAVSVYALNYGSSELSYLIFLIFSTASAFNGSIVGGSGDFLSISGLRCGGSGFLLCSCCRFWDSHWGVCGI